MTRTFKISLLSGKRSSDAIMAELSLEDLVANLTRYHAQETKDGPSWSPKRGRGRPPGSGKKVEFSAPPVPVESSSFDVSVMSIEGPESANDVRFKLTVKIEMERER